MVHVNLSTIGLFEVSVCTDMKIEKATESQKSSGLGWLGDRH